MIRIGERIVDLFQLQPGTSVTARGWVKTLRNSKETGFIQLTDGSCFKDLQVVVDGGDEACITLSMLNFTLALTVFSETELLFSTIDSRWRLVSV